MITTGPRVDVLGVGVDSVSMSTAVQILAGWIERGERRYVCVTGVHGVMESQRDPELMRIHRDSGLTVPDGMPLVWSARYAGVKAATRVYGPDLMLAVLERARQAGWSSFLYGGGPGTAPLLVRRLTERFPGLAIAGTLTPPFRELLPDEDREIVDAINASGAQLVWVGLSTPKQERWMAEHVERLRGPCVVFGVGAAFDIHAGLKRDAPEWMRATGLHWVYRLAREPRRLWRRYLRNNPAFVWQVVRRPPRRISPSGSPAPIPDAATKPGYGYGFRARLGSWAGKQARARRHLVFRRRVAPRSGETIVDIGCGSAGLAEFEPHASITGVDLAERPPAGYESGNRDYVQADARSLPFADREFDIAYSNSLIEHVPPGDRQRVASEARRVGRRYFVQTPNRWFPIEPHVLLPCFQHLPRRLRKRLWRFGVHTGPFEDIRLLDAAELRSLFPDAIIARERLGPLTKSLMAIGPRDLVSEAESPKRGA
jgi:N-acetylglucosaminyldiphosphoundecaprenol N-acetyl-beta-D-mannosaminyltransferase